MLDEEELNTITGKRLRTCRKASNQTLEQLAETSGYSVQHLIRIEKGRQRMTLEAAEMLASALHIRKEYLLNKDAYRTLAEKQKDDLVIDDEINHSLVRILIALGYTISPIEAIYEDSETGEMCSTNEYDFGEWPSNMKHIGDINGYVVFEQDGNLQTLEEGEFKKQFPNFLKLNSTRYELTYYDFPDKVILTDDDLNDIFNEIFDLIGFVMDRQKDIRNNK